jgi:hypothetical protein
VCWWADAALTNGLHTGRYAVRGDRIVRGPNFDRLLPDTVTTVPSGALRFSRDSSRSLIVWSGVGRWWRWRRWSWLSQQVPAGRAAAALRCGGVV